MKKASAAAPGGEKMSAELDDRRLKRLQRQLEKEDDVEERLGHAFLWLSFNVPIQHSYGSHHFKQPKYLVLSPIFP